MRWLLSLATRVKLLLGFGLMVLFLAAAVAAAYRSISTIQESQQRLYREDFASALDLMSLRANENGVRAALLTMLSLTKRSDQEAWQQDIKERSKDNDDIMRRLRERGRDDQAFLRSFDELDRTRVAYKQTRDIEIIPLIYEGKGEEAKKVALGIQAERYKTMRSISKELGEEAVARAEHRIAESENRARTTVRLFLMVGLAALGTALLMVGWLNRVIASPLKGISVVAERVASGDLTVVVPAGDRADEVGVLNQTFGRMVEALREVNRQIREGVNVLGSSASEILAATAQVAAGATETATAVGETTTTVEEVKQTAQVSSQKAKHVSESAQKAAQISQGGRKAVEDAIEGMHRIREQMESIAASILKLSDQSQSIGEIVATVNDLAEQSNLLAVNAAIEAAKAGEQGRGFAVVAQEVKSLAEQSKQATAQVRGILGDIQKATSAAVMATEQGSKAVAAGMKQSTEAGDSIRMLADSIAEASQAATQIAASSQQQLVGMDQVALAMENIKQATTQNVASTKQAEVAAKSLSELGQKLKAVVERYRV